MFDPEAGKPGDTPAEARRTEKERVLEGDGTSRDQREKRS